MRSYTVTITENTEGEVIVEAESKKQAEAIVQKNWDAHQYDQEMGCNLFIEATLIQPREDQLTVLFVPVGGPPEVKKIDNEFHAMQQAIGGYIEVYPLEKDVALICNEEGKLSGAPLNRMVYDENHRSREVIAGDFFLCSAPVDGEDFESLSPEQCEKYKKRFKYPERFCQSAKGIQAVPIKPKAKDPER